MSIIKTKQKVEINEEITNCCIIISNIKNVANQPKASTSRSICPPLANTTDDNKEDDHPQALVQSLKKLKQRDIIALSTMMGRSVPYKLLGSNTGITTSYLAGLEQVT